MNSVPGSVCLHQSAITSDCILPSWVHVYVTVVGALLSVPQLSTHVCSLH